MVEQVHVCFRDVVGVNVGGEVLNRFREVV